MWTKWDKLRKQVYFPDKKKNMGAQTFALSHKQSSAMFWKRGGTHVSCNCACAQHNAHALSVFSWLSRVEIHSEKLISCHVWEETNCRSGFVGGRWWIWGISSRRWVNLISVCDLGDVEKIFDGVSVQWLSEQLAVLTLAVCWFCYIVS